MQDTDKKDEKPSALEGLFRAFARYEIARDEIIHGRVKADPEKFDLPRFQTFSAIAQQAIKAVPFSFDRDAVDFVDSLSETEKRISKVKLPFPFTWIAFRVGLKERDTDSNNDVAAVMLHENQSGKITATICEVTDQFELEVPSPFLRENARNKLHALGKGVQLYLQPEIEFNRNDQRSIIGHPKALRYADASDYSFDISDCTFDSKDNPILSSDEFYEEMTWRVQTAVLFANAIAEKNPLFPFIVENIKRPNTATDKMLFGSGKVPKRTHNIVRLDTTQATKILGTNLDPPAAKLQNAEEHRQALPAEPTQTTGPMQSEKSSAISIDTPPLFLNDVFQRFTKIRIWKNKGATPFASDLRGEALMSKESAANMDRFLTGTENMLRRALPYQFPTDEALSILSEEEYDIAKDITLPSPITWIDNCAAQTDKNIESGALLLDEGKGEISVTLFIQQPLQGLPQNYLGRLEDTVSPAELKLLSPQIRKLSGLGEHKVPLLIIPNIVLNRDTNKISPPNSGAIFPLIIESDDRIPMVTDYSKSLEKLGKDDREALRLNWMHLAAKSIRLARVVTKKDPRIQISSAPKPKPSDDSLSIQMGKAPKRKASVVTVDPHYVENNLIAEEANTVVLRSPEKSHTEVAKSIASEPISLADFVIESGRLSTSDWQNALYPIGRALVPNVKRSRAVAKRFVFDETVEAVMERISVIPFEDFAAQIAHIRMPFECMWFEDTSPKEPQGIRKYVQRKGYLATKTGETITGRYVAERVISAHENVEDREEYEHSLRQMGAYFRNGAATFCQGIDLILGKTGITGTGGKSFLEIHETTQKMAFKGIASVSPEVLAEGTEQNAQYLCRLLVALSSQNVLTNVEESRLDTTPGKLHTLHFELSTDLDEALARGDIDAARNLLGWADEKLQQPTIATTTPDAEVNAPATIAGIPVMDISKYIAEARNEDPSELLLNDVFRRIAKIRIFSKDRPMSNRYASDLNLEASMPVESALRLERILYPTENSLRRAIPYKFLSSAVAAISDHEKNNIERDLSLPSPVTWIDIPTGEGNGIPSTGALLIDERNGKVSVTLFLSQARKGFDMQAFTAASEKAEQIAQNPRLSRLRNKLEPLGTYEEPLLIIPNMIFDQSERQIMLPGGETTLPIVVDSHNGYPWFTNYNETLKNLDKDVIAEFYKNCAQAAIKAVQLADAIAHDDPWVKINLAPKPKPAEDRIHINLGKAPKRTASLVIANPDYNPDVTLTDPVMTAEIIEPAASDITPISPPTNDISLADFVIESGRLATGYGQKTLYPIGRALISNPKHSRSGAKRFLIDQKLNDILDKTYCIPFEEFVAQYQHTIMPLGSVWFETTNFERSAEDPEIARRGGILVTRSEDSIVVRTVREYISPANSSPKALEQHEKEARVLGRYFRNNRIVASDDVELVFRNNRLTATSGEQFDWLHNILEKRIDEREGLTEDMLEPSIREAQAFFRFFFLISSPNVTTNVWQILNEANAANIDPGDLHSVHIHLEPELESALSVGDVDAIKRLLGWGDKKPLDPVAETAMTEEGLQTAAVIESVIAAEEDIPQGENEEIGADSKASETVLSEDELLEREIKWIDALAEAKEYLLAEAAMYLAQAQNRDLNRFECRIILTKPGFPIQLQFSKELEMESGNKTNKAIFTLDHYDQKFTERGLPLTMNDAVDLKIIVQSMICNTEGIIPIHDPSVSGQRVVELDTQMPLPISDYKIIQRSGGMYTLIMDARDPYTRDIIHPSIPLGLAARHEDREAEKYELENRVTYVLDYLVQIENERTPEGHRIYVSKRDVRMKLEAHVAEQKKEWVTQERLSLPGFETSTLLHVSAQSNQKVTLAPVRLHMDVGGDNPSWHCELLFHIGDKAKPAMGEVVRARILNLHTGNKSLAIARALESLTGVKARSGEQKVEGFLRDLQKHLRTTRDEWRVEYKGTRQEEVFIGKQPLQFFLEDMMRYERDIGVMLDKHEIGETGNVTISIQALRGLTGDYGRSTKVTPEYVYESEGGERKPIAFTLTIPGDRSFRIERFVEAAHEHVRWHADEAYSSVALGMDNQPDQRKKPLEYRTSQIRRSVIRAVEELFQQHFMMRLPKNWHGRDKKQDTTSPKRQKAQREANFVITRDDFPIG